MKALLLIGLGTSLLVLAGCSGSDQPDAVAQPPHAGDLASLAVALDASESAANRALSPPAEQPIVPENAIADWVHSFDSVPPMAATAGLVVVGTVTSSESRIFHESRDEDGNVLNTLSGTAWTITVTDTLKGESAPAIRVNQTNGISDDPLFVEGATYVLFLGCGESDVYCVLGGPDGRLVVDEDTGTADALSVAYPERNISDLGIRDMPLDELAALVSGS